MKIFLNENVFDAAVSRINWIFDEFENIVVNCSGGKDSTVVLNLVLQEAERRGRLPVKVLFVDQEAEWDCVIDYMRQIRADPRVEMHWLQVSIKMSNATSFEHPWSTIWEEGKDAEWIRPKEPDSYHENVFGTQVFVELFQAFREYQFGEFAKVATIAGVRCEESPGRLQGLTSYATYKGETWGKKEKTSEKSQSFTFYPLYDWSYTDIWKAIHEHGWPYCKIYDYQYQHGIPVRQMRVSNLHHDSAITSLFYMQEIKSDNWNRITTRYPGINTAGHMRKDMKAPTVLPPMFQDWRDYRDHLLKYLITDPDLKTKYADLFRRTEAKYEEEAQKALLRTHITILLVNDFSGVKMSNFHAQYARFSKGRGKLNQNIVEATGVRPREGFPARP